MREVTKQKRGMASQIDYRGPSVQAQRDLPTRCRERDFKHGPRAESELRSQLCHLLAV